MLPWKGTSNETGTGENLLSKLSYEVSYLCRDGKVQNIASPGDVEGAKSTPAYEEVIHPERVIYPLKRKGRRGSAQWDRISWDDALDTMAEKFAQVKEHYGVDSVATIRG